MKVENQKMKTKIKFEGTKSWTKTYSLDAYRKERWDPPSPLLLLCLRFQEINRTLFLSLSCSWLLLLSNLSLSLRSPCPFSSQKIQVLSLSIHTNMSYVHICIDLFRLTCFFSLLIFTFIFNLVMGKQVVVWRTLLAFNNFSG